MPEQLVETTQSDMIAPTYAARVEVTTKMYTSVAIPPGTPGPGPPARYAPGNVPSESGLMW